MGTISAVSRQKDFLDIFTVSPDGHIYTAAWTPYNKNAAWYGWWQRESAKFPRNATVSSVVYGDGLLYIFAVDTAGRVLGNQWYTHAPDQSRAGWSGWHHISGVTASPGAHIGACAEGGRINIFLAGKDKKVWTAAHLPQAPTEHSWSAWSQILPSGINAVPGSPISAVVRSLGWIDIFLADERGLVMTAAWYEGNTIGWHGWWQIQSGMVPPGGYVTAVVRNTDQLDIFAVDKAGQCVSAAWNPHQKGGWHGWFAILPETRFVPGACISAVSRSQDLLDIFGVANDGRAMTAAWAPTHEWKGWWHINGGLGLPGLPLTACVRSENHLDVFMAGKDVQAWTAAWQSDFKDWFHGWSNILGMHVATPLEIYKFSIPKMNIVEIRSRINDTLHLSLSVAVKGQDPVTHYRFLGDQKPGQKTMGDSVNLTLKDDEWAVFSYLLVNNGHGSRPEIEKKLQDASAFLAKKGADAAVGNTVEAVGTAVGTAIGAAVGSGVVPLVGTALGALAGWLVTNGLEVVFKNCDGPVASGVHIFRGADLRAALEKGGKIEGADRVKTNDVSGAFSCGAPSDYDVHYEVSLP